MSFSILFIDDDEKVLDELVAATNTLLSGDTVDIRKWVPTGVDLDPLPVFNSKVDEGTILVVTDFDLTAGGTLGLFGSTIIGWCQAKLIPVGDYSRRNVGNLPLEPNPFELRVPNKTEQAAAYLANIFRGFRDIREQSATNASLLKAKRGPAAVLSEMLGAQTLENQLAQYNLRLSTSNATLLATIQRTVEQAEGDSAAVEKRLVTNYIVGHMLLNAVLRFPGPIISSQALCAYVGVGDSETAALCGFFEVAAYVGPFSGMGKFFWLHKLDEILAPLLDALPSDLAGDTGGEFHREALELHLNRKLARHRCARCAGMNGGFWCPFTQATVCQKAECSVASSGWIPQGATLCRIERDFYDEWSPIVGL
ncbi:MAG TPA: hypothetical protein VHY84_04685 [Bryobacteraceae bacterium]|jgi:hypothetical protein|nr:hypothetical protein [Bryobacteraceae bacterium]